MNISQPHFVDTQRVRFAYSEGGEAAGGPLVMIHGWLESSSCWKHLAGYLRPGLRIIAPDLQGLGDSERTEGLAHYLKVELARDVIEVLGALGAVDFQLVGHDWAGIVAQEIALVVPVRVRRLILFNIAVINNLEGTQKVIRALRELGSRSIGTRIFSRRRDWLRFRSREPKKCGCTICCVPGMGAPFPPMPSRNTCAVTVLPGRLRAEQIIIERSAMTPDAGPQCVIIAGRCRLCICMATRIRSSFRNT